MGWNQTSVEQWLKKSKISAGGIQYILDQGITDGEEILFLRDQEKDKTELMVGLKKASDIKKFKTSFEELMELITANNDEEEEEEDEGEKLVKPKVIKSNKSRKKTKDTEKFEDEVEEEEEEKEEEITTTKLEEDEVENESEDDQEMKIEEIILRLKEHCTSSLRTKDAICRCIDGQKQPNKVTPRHSKTGDNELMIRKYNKTKLITPKHKMDKNETKIINEEEEEEDEEENGDHEDFERGPPKLITKELEKASDDDDESEDDDLSESKPKKEDKVKDKVKDKNDDESEDDDLSESKPKKEAQEKDLNVNISPKPSTNSAELFLQKLFKNLGTPSFMTSKYIQSLKDDYVTSIEQLREFDDGDWKRYGFKKNHIIMIKNKLRTEDGDDEEEDDEDDDEDDDDLSFDDDDGWNNDKNSNDKNAKTSKQADESTTDFDDF